MSPQSGEWGIKTDEDIPLGSFVCTVAGQARRRLTVFSCGESRYLALRFYLWWCVPVFRDESGAPDSSCPWTNYEIRDALLETRVGDSGVGGEELP